MAEADQAVYEERLEQTQDIVKLTAYADKAYASGHLGLGHYLVSTLLSQAVNELAGIRAAVRAHTALITRKSGGS
jgi:hypothetical protein